MRNYIGIVNLGDIKINKSNVYNLNDFKSLNELVNSLDSHYVIFTREISDLNLDKINNLYLSKEEKSNDIILFLDSLDYLPNKVDIKDFKENFLETLLLKFENILIRKELISNLDLNKEYFINLEKFNKEIYVCLKEESICKKNLILNFSIEDIFKLEKFSSKQKYIYIYNILEIILKQINSLDRINSINILKILQKEIKKIDQEEYMLFLENILNYEEFNRISTAFHIVANGLFSQMLFLSKQYDYNKQLVEENKKTNFEHEKITSLIKKERLRIVIFYDKIISMLRKSLVFFEYILSKPFFLGKDIWLIGERSDQAEDNAFRFFKYVRENHPKDKIYYIIDKKSIQYENVEALGNVININSFKHRIYLMHAKKLISAYDFFNFLLPSDSKRFKNYNMKYMNTTRIFLQHGVAMNKANYYNKYINKYHYILASTNKEYNMFKMEYGYDDDKIIKIGLPRYDQLIDKSINNKQKSILFMPTWRNSLVKLSKDEFKNTQYYNDIVSLINDKELNIFIEKNNLKLIVYLHYEIQIFNDCFNFTGKNVVFMNRENAVVQDLLKECNLLITDYSSVGVDFAYLDKPVIFYQFSGHNFHYNINKEERYTLYSDFGKVVTSKEDVILTLKEWKKNKYENFYKIDDKLFFNRNSIDNCKKIYEFIKKIPQEDVKEHIIELSKDSNIKEKRIYDKNYNFISREFFNKGIKTSKLIYKNGFINKQMVYNPDKKIIKEVKFYKNIKISTKYFDVYDKKGNAIIKHSVSKNGILSSKIFYYKNSDKIETITKYNVKTEKVSSIKHFYKDGKLKSNLIYTEDGYANKYYYYNEEGKKIREYSYYESGKVKLKKFYNKETGEVIKIQNISEINQKVISEKIFDKNSNKFIFKKCFDI